MRVMLIALGARRWEERNEWIGSNLAGGSFA